MSITESKGYLSLSASIEKDKAEDRGFVKTGRYFHDYDAALAWAVARAEQYAAATGIDAALILDSWEARRRYWYLNYYQDANIPPVVDDKVRVFETTEDLRASIKVAAFRCPSCKGVSKDPYVCSCAGCDWKVYGLFGHMGLGVAVFIKENMALEKIFMPVKWETAPSEVAHPLQ